MKALQIISFILVVIGGLNWGLIGAFGYDVVATIFGMGGVAKTIYILVGLAALYEIFTYKKVRGGAQM